jgi:hypothetical protein
VNLSRIVDVILLVGDSRSNFTNVESYRTVQPAAIARLIRIGSSRVCGRSIVVHGETSE